MRLTITANNMLAVVGSAMIFFTLFKFLNFNWFNSLIISVWAGANIYVVLFGFALAQARRNHIQADREDID